MTGHGFTQMTQIIFFLDPCEMVFNFTGQAGLTRFIGYLLPDFHEENQEIQFAYDEEKI